MSTSCWEAGVCSKPAKNGSAGTGIALGAAYEATHRSRRFSGYDRGSTTRTEGGSSPPGLSAGPFVYRGTSPDLSRLGASFFFSHSASDYKFRKSGDRWKNATFSKYNCVEGHGVTDNKDVLEPVDDAARAKWGGAWRIPTVDEWRELLDNCTWQFTTKGGKKGYEVKSKVNGNSIFFPAAGTKMNGGTHNVGIEGVYWSANLSYPKAPLYDRIPQPMSGLWI